MLTVQECRKILCELELSDREIERLHDFIYSVSAEVLDQLYEKN